MSEPGPSFPAMSIEAALELAREAEARGAKAAVQECAQDFMDGTHPDYLIIQEVDRSARAYSLGVGGGKALLAQLSQLMRLRWVFEGCWGEKRESFQGLPIGNRV